MDISIIIVNWNSADYVLTCLATIYSNLQNISFEVIVVDNASHDGCKGLMHEHFPQAMYVQSKKNVGFAKANNLGYEHSSGRSILFLNPDTEVKGSAVQTLLHYLWKLPNAGAIGCKLLNTDGSIQTSCIQPFPTLMNQFLDAEVLRQKFPLHKLWGISPLYEKQSSPVPVDVVSGACILVKRAVFKHVEFFSTEYFMYAEDVDLCYKIKKAGYDVYYAGDATVLHHGGGSSRKREVNYFAALAIRHAVQKFLQKSRGKLYGSMYRISTGVAAFFRVIFISCLFVTTFDAEKRKDLKISFSKWTKILNWSLYRKKWARTITH